MGINYSHDGNFFLAYLKNLNYYAQSFVVSFPLYGRLAEARYSRKKKAGGTNRDIWGRQNHKPKKVQWYNKHRYAGYGRLVARLTAGMSDRELQRIRGILEEARRRMAAQ